MADVLCRVFDVAFPQFASIDDDDCYEVNDDAEEKTTAVIKISAATFPPIRRHSRYSRAHTFALRNVIHPYATRFRTLTSLSAFLLLFYRIRLHFATHRLLAFLLSSIRYQTYDADGKCVPSNSDNVFEGLA